MILRFVILLLVSTGLYACASDSGGGKSTAARISEAKGFFSTLPRMDAMFDTNDLAALDTDTDFASRFDMASFAPGPQGDDGIEGLSHTMGLSMKAFGEAGEAYLEDFSLKEYLYVDEQSAEQLVVSITGGLIGPEGVKFAATGNIEDVDVALTASLAMDIAALLTSFQGSDNPGNAEFDLAFAISGSLSAPDASLSINEGAFSLVMGAADDATSDGEFLSSIDAVFDVSYSAAAVRFDGAMTMSLINMRMQFDLSQLLARTGNFDSSAQGVANAEQDSGDFMQAMGSFGGFDLMEVSFTGHYDNGEGKQMFAEFGLFVDGSHYEMPQGLRDHLSELDSPADDSEDDAFFADFDESMLGFGPDNYLGVEASMTLRTEIEGQTYFDFWMELSSMGPESGVVSFTMSQGGKQISGTMSEIADGLTLEDSEGNRVTLYIDAPDGSEEKSDADMPRSLGELGVDGTIVGELLWSEEGLSVAYIDGSSETVFGFE